MTTTMQKKEIRLILKEAQLGLHELKRWAPLNWYERHLYEKATKYFTDESEDNYNDAFDWLHKCAADGALPNSVSKKFFLTISVCEN